MDKFLRISTALYLAVIILVRMMAMPISLAEFSMNKKYITENLCENRANAAIQCGGKCFLSKKLAKSNDSQDAQNSQGTIKILSVDYCEHTEQLSFQFETEILLHSAFYDVSKIPSSNISSVFRPPIFTPRA
jgi:hypothetical protein